MVIKRIIVKMARYLGMFIKRARHVLPLQRGQRYGFAPASIHLLTISLLTTLLLLPPLHAQQQAAYPIKLTAPAKRYILTEDGRRTSYYEITYQQPMMVEMTGPLSVIIEMRLNLDAYSPIIPDLIELIVERDEETYDVYRVTPKSVGEEKYENIVDIIPSAKTTVRIDVPPGMHSYVLSISASAGFGATLQFTIPGAIVTKKPEPEKKPPEKPAPEKPAPQQKQAQMPAPVKIPQKAATATKPMRVQPFLGGGISVETYSALGFYLRGGVGLDAIISEPVGIIFALGSSYYPTKYYAYDNTIYELQNPSVSEIKADATPMVTITATGKKFSRYYIEPSAGARITYFSAQDFTRMFLGPAAGVNFGIPLFESLTVRGIIGGAYNLIDNKDNRAITGNPKVEVFTNIGVTIPVNHSYTLNVGYDGDFLGYPKTTITYGSNTVALNQNMRTYNGVFVGIEF
ncbi:MAG TPA: hypothetical protein VII00_07160 [bacterium]